MTATDGTGAGFVQTQRQSVYDGQTVKSSSPNSQSERYAGQPLLVLLESYVLDCIGELPPDQHDRLDTVVQNAFGGHDGWRETLRAKLSLQPALDRELASLWKQNQSAAEEAGGSLDPVEFARMVVDANFAHLFETVGAPR